jgi:glycosyltransferase involved in cell wall biosynthesis
MIEPRKDGYAFSFQTQSLYDCSTPGLPHFIYSDHSHLANLMYPAFSRTELFPRDWIDLERETYNRARHIFVMSEHVRRSLVDQYGCDPQRTAAVGGGSNVDPTPVPLQNDEYRNQTIVFVGVDWERKGGPTLIEAFQRVRTRFPNARLVIIGTSPVVREPGIEILGRVPREEVKARLARASIFCMPTRIEPFGVAVVEAFFHELPVVATNIGAMPGLVCDGENGRLVPPDDPQALAEALIELLSDPEKCRRFGQAGRELVSKRYSWEIAVERIRAFINEDLAADRAKESVRPEKLAAA